MPEPYKEQPSYNLQSLLDSLRFKAGNNPFPLDDWETGRGTIQAADFDPHPNLKLHQLIDHILTSVKTSNDAQRIYRELTGLYIDALGRPYGEVFFKIGEAIGPHMALPLNLERRPDEPDLSRVSIDDLLSSLATKVFYDPGKGVELNITRRAPALPIDPLRNQRFFQVFLEIIRRIKNIDSVDSLEKIRQKIYRKIAEIDIFGKIYIQDFLDLGIAIGNQKEELEQQVQTQAQS